MFASFIHQNAPQLTMLLFILILTAPVITLVEYSHYKMRRKFKEDAALKRSLDAQTDWSGRLEPWQKVGTDALR